MDGQMNVVYIIALCSLIASVSGLCDFLPVNSIKETDPGGTIILNVSTTAGDNATLRVLDSGQQTVPNFVTAMENRLLLKTSNTRLTLENTKPLDLEEFLLQYKRDITTLTVKITCNGIESDVLLRIEPVNEFPPVFVKSPYNITISESIATGSIIYNLKENVSDEDVGVVHNFIFKIYPYNVGVFDGLSFFGIPAASKGNIEVIKTLDFDDSSIRNPLILNVSVADGQSSSSKTTFTVLTIHIQDADDQAPYFNFPNCPKPCPAPPFEAITRLDYTGQLTISPNPLTAKDDDTLRTSLIYSIQSGNQHNLFDIDQNTGAISQKTSVNALNLPDAEFRLVIQVRKDLTGVDLSSIAILTIHVWERMTNKSGYPEPPVGQSKENADSGPGLLIPVIVLGVLFAIVLVALVVIFIIYRKKQREMSIRPSDDKSEPQTEEEDLHTEGEDYAARTDSNEKLIFGNKTTLGIMTDLPDVSDGKANQLPPLPMRDTGTETDEKKGKKSRRRHKKKEPEIFDGTREYNMGVDPEFFDSTDKSKVKRSQRSRKADPPLPIQVPNDNPVDEESVYM